MSVSGNLITTDGWEIILNRTFKSVPDYLQPSTIQVGQDAGTSPTISTTDLTKRVPIASVDVDIIDNCSAANWTEAGQASAEATNAVTYKPGGGQTDNTGLSLGKSGVAATTFYYSKSTTSFDGTGKVAYVWVYFLDVATINKLATADAVTFRLGSDASNYYQYTYDRSALAVGWNLFKLDLSVPETTTGSPAIAALDYSYIGMATTNNADTIASGYIVMDLWHAASETECNTAFTALYPSIDETKYEVTIRGILYGPEAVGYLIDSFAIKNADATKKLFSIAVLGSAESKSEDDEFIINAKYRREE